MTPAPQAQDPADEFIIKREELERVEAACRNEYGEYIGHVNDEFFDCIYSRPVPSPQSIPEFTPYIPGQKEEVNTYRCCEICSNVPCKPLFRVNCLRKEHDTAIRNAVLDLIIKFRKDNAKEYKIHDMWVAEAEYLESLRGKP